MDEKPMTNTLPIVIQSQSRHRPDQYSLNNIRFDPIIQNSPPNSWNKRLNKRVGQSTAFVSEASEKGCAKLLIKPKNL